MKPTRSLLSTLAVLAVALILTCCNSNTTTAQENLKPVADTASIAVQPAIAQELDVLEITHTVKDYATWRPMFNSDASNRKAAGLEDMVVGQVIDHPNNIAIYMKAADPEKAKQFISNPQLKEVMGKAGVTGKPEIRTFHLIRHNPNAKENQWVTITHRVKDFDAWIKLYDGEGKEKRASQGMIDVALGRSSDDPNLVLIVFDVTDLDKARAAIFSEEKKKLMLSAGVEGKPNIQFYNTAQ